MIAGGNRLSLTEAGAETRSSNALAKGGGFFAAAVGIAESGGGV